LLEILLGFSGTGTHNIQKKIFFTIFWIIKKNYAEIDTKSVYKLII
jgi:hypothetical protein